MSRLRVLPIVEGHGEDAAIRILLERTWAEFLNGEHIQVLRPIRWPKSKLRRSADLKRAVELAYNKLDPTKYPDPSLIFIVVDADADAPCYLGPRLLQYAMEARSDADIACVIANVEYETWFVASAESLADYIQLEPDETAPADPEAARSGEAWIQRHFRGTRYSKTVDQPAMTRAMDLALCRAHSRSFDKLCRDLGRRLRAG